MTYTDPYKDATTFKGHYSKGKFPQPSAVMSQEPNKEYFLAWHRFVYSLFCGGGCSTYPSGMYDVRSIAELRSYAQGKMDKNKYKNLLDVRVKDGEIKDGSGASLGGGSLFNISWDTHMFYPKYRSLAASKASASDFAANIRAIDNQSAFDRRRKYQTAKLATDPRMQQLFGQAQVMPDEAKAYGGMAPEDIDMAMQAGDFALPFEVAMEDVVGCTFDLSKWEEISDQLRKDQIDFNKMGCVVELNATTQQLQIKYVVPDGIIIPPSAYNDHRTDQFRAFIERTNIANLRAESGMEEKELWDIAQRYGSFGVNAQTKNAHGTDFFSRDWRDGFYQNSRQQVYDHFAVDVMNLWFIACKVESMVVGRNPDGSQYSRMEPADYQMTPEEEVSGYRKSTTTTQYLYKSKWIIGTQCVYSYGVDDTIGRDGEAGAKTAMIPFLVWTSEEASITERCIAAVDDIQMAILKIRLLISQLPPGPRMFIDMSVLSDAVELGGKTYDMRSLLKLFGATGKLFGRSRNEWGNQNEASNKKPIMDIPVNIQEDFNLFSSEIVRGLDTIRQSTGLNEISDGTGNPRDVLNKVAAGFQEASNNALEDVVKGQGTMYKNLATVIVKKYQSLALHGDVAVKNWPVDANTLSTITLPKDIYMYDFGVAINLLPTQQEIELMTQKVFADQQERKITDNDVFVVMQMLRNKDIKKAQLYLARAVEKAAKQEHARQLELINSQAEANAKSVQAAEQAKQATVMAKTQGAGQLADQQEGIDSRLATQKHGFDMELIGKKAEADLGVHVGQKTIETALTPEGVTQQQ